MMKLGVPRKRAIDSAHWPLRSGLEDLRRKRIDRFSPLGRSSERSAKARTRRLVLVKLLAPVVRQQVVKHVVYRNRPPQVVIVIDDRQRQDVVGRHAPRY